MLSAFFAGKRLRSAGLTSISFPYPHRAIAG